MGEPKLEDHLVNPFVKPYDVYEELEQVRLGLAPQGLGIGVPDFDKHVSWKQGQFNLVNGHDNVGKTDIMLWYFVCMAKLHNKTFNLFSSENTYRSQIFKIFNFWTGKRMDKDFIKDENGYKRTLNEITDCFKLIKTDKRFTAKQILDIADTNSTDGLLIDPFNSLLTETNNKHQEDYDICADIRIFSMQTNTTTFINTHLVTNAARNLYPKDHEYEGHLRPPLKADTEGGQKFANRADDFWSVHRMTQHPDRWSVTELHVRKVKETITGGSKTPLESPIELNWSNYSRYDIGGINPLQKTYEDSLGDNNIRDIGQNVVRSKQHTMMSRQSYGFGLDEDYSSSDLPF